SCQKELQPLREMSMNKSGKFNICPIRRSKRLWMALVSCQAKSLSALKLIDNVRLRTASGDPVEMDNVSASSRSIPAVGVCAPWEDLGLPFRVSDDSIGRGLGSRSLDNLEQSGIPALTEMNRRSRLFSFLRLSV